MTLELASLAGICLLILVANLEQRRRDELESSGLSAAPESIVGRFWRLVSALCKGLDLGRRARFEPSNMVHRTAALLMIGYALLTLAMLSQSEESSRLSVISTETFDGMLRLVITSAAYLVAALLGVGWLTRRRFAAVLQRLDLKLPNRRDWLEGLALACALFVLAQTGVALWADLAPPALFDIQTHAARHIFESLNASWLAGMLFALTAALSEEILFRGALQPIFGIVISSLLFALLHTQYLLTPAALILLVVSLGFGWLRTRRNTSAAIICHAAYNALPFLMHRLAV
ncbi:MAG: type II CAAX endopeptidase family protein [Chloroflexi bacterium]|nr:type II CAAX endopeptidase family protein [Chloroflexota bacterium]